MCANASTYIHCARDVVQWCDGSETWSSGLDIKGTLSDTSEDSPPSPPSEYSIYTVRGKGECHFINVGCAPVPRTLGTIITKRA